MTPLLQILLLSGLSGASMGVPDAKQRMPRVRSIAWYDDPPDRIPMGSAKPDLLHKFAWALPGSLSRELVKRLEHFGYDSAPIPAHTVKTGPSSLLEKGRRTLSVHQRTHAVTQKELKDAKHGLAMFVLERARRQADGHDMEGALKITTAVTKLLDKAQKHMEELGTMKAQKHMEEL